MNQSNKWAVSPLPSEALVPCAPAGDLVVTTLRAELKTPFASVGTEVQPTQAAKREDAVASGRSANAANPNQKADLEAIEAWENEGDPN